MYFISDEWEYIRINESIVWFVDLGPTFEAQQANGSGWEPWTQAHEKCLSQNLKQIQVCVCARPRVLHYCIKCSKQFAGTSRIAQSTLTLRCEHSNTTILSNLGACFTCLSLSTSPSQPCSCHDMCMVQWCFGGKQPKRWLLQGFDLEIKLMGI